MSKKAVALFETNEYNRYASVRKKNLGANGVRTVLKAGKMVHGEKDMVLAT